MPRSRDTTDGLPARPSVQRGRLPVRPRPLHDRRGRLQGTPRRARAEALRSRLTNLTPADRSWQGLGRWKHPTGEIPMPKFVIERQYLVPMYQHIVVEAESLEEACKQGISDDIDWDTQEMDCDSARATTITEAKVIPEGYDVDQFRRVLVASRDPRGLPLDMLTLATFLYLDEAKTGPLLE